MKIFITVLGFILITLNTYSQLNPSLSNKIEGMLIGSAIGDAAGGPVEFVQPIKRSHWCTVDQIITSEGIKELGGLFKLRPYPKKTEPFAQWEDYAPEGTITDDTRFKLIFFNCLKENKGKLTQPKFARSVLNFRETLPDKYRDNYDDWIPEIEYATRWALGERENAYPVERIWGGIPTMEGQMPFLPIAALFPNNPDSAYLKTYELGYFDIGIAKDINSALVAGLCGALQPEGSWELIEKTMLETDPYNYSKVLYVQRQLEKWIKHSHYLVQKANGNINKLFYLLETEIETVTWWETWVPLVVVLACAEIVNYDPMASMQLMMEFGHDTDSYAQVMGAFMGAIHGKNIFPEEIRNTVNIRMKEQFGQNINDWMLLIKKYGRLN
ncbi:MAG: ADP-ribosylglycohydrolase family protein [Mariniphaga sp.]|nr:ADP-ribosylglycohydrolase family protein [Mariniphaga sp.]